MLPPRVAAAAVLALAACAVAAVGVVSRREPSRAKASAEFQRVVGGLGLGAAIDLSECDPAFDPRGGARCADATGPFPGGRRFCVHLGGPEPAAR